MNAWDPIAIGLIAAAVLILIVVLAMVFLSRFLLTRLLSGLIQAQTGKLGELERQITTAEGRHEAARREIATLEAIELDEEVLAKISWEARALLLASKRAALQQAQAAQRQYGDQLTKTQARAADPNRGELWSQDVVRLTDLYDQQCERVKELAAFVEQLAEQLKGAS